MGMKGQICRPRRWAFCCTTGLGTRFEFLDAEAGVGSARRSLCGLRSFAVVGTAGVFAKRYGCPGCGRTTSSTFQELAELTQNYIREMMPTWKTQYDGVENMTLAVMGCIVNGPGESKAASIGISLPGTGEAPRCPVYIDGKKDVTLEGTYDELAVAFQALVDNYVATKYPRKVAEVSAER